MLTFAYTARDPAGAVVRDRLQAPSKADALRQLQRDGCVVTDIRPVTTAVDPDEVLIRQAAKQVRRDDVIALASQLSIMLETGVPLSDALDAYVEQSKSRHMKRVMGAVAEQITSGAPFSDAIAAFPRVFPTSMISLMRASEASGTMGEMLERIGDYLGRERRTAKQITGALTYPAVMVAVALSVTGFLVVWVLPRFAQIYASREAALPKPTKVLLGASDFLSGNWPAIAAAALGLVVGVLWLRATQTGKHLIDHAKLALPVLGPMFRQFYLTRATRTLGTLLASGVPLLDSVRIVRGVTSNAAWDRFWDDVEEAMTAGKTISSVVTGSKLIPPAVGQMICAGERTGKLADVLERVSVAAEEELDRAIKTGTQLIEPAMILFMGVTIGGIAMALLLPIFSIANVVSG